MAGKQDALISAQTSVLGSMIIDSRCVPVVMKRPWLSSASR